MRCLLTKVTGPLLLLCCFCIQIRSGSSESTYRDRSGQFRVAVSKVHIEILDATNAGVPLKCELTKVFPRAEVRWQDDNGTTIPFLFLESCYRGDVCNISITAHVNKTETNNFTCVVRQPDLYHEFKQKVHVPESLYRDRSGETGDAVSKVHTEILDPNEAGVPLRCELIEVFPRAEVRWQDDNGTTISSSGSQSCRNGDICNVSMTSNVTKTATNIFYCVVRQPEIYHEFKQKVHVPDKMFQVCKDDSSSDDTRKSTGFWIGLVIGGVLTGVLGTLAAIFRRHLPAKCGCVESAYSDDVASEQHSRTESQLLLCGDGGSRGENPQDESTNTTDLRGPTSNGSTSIAVQKDPDQVRTRTTKSERDGDRQISS